MFESEDCKYCQQTSSIHSKGRARVWCALVLSVFLLAGCGKTLITEGTEQLLASDAVDGSIASLDFSPLAGQKVYFDETYIKTIKGVGFVNGDYIVSAIRQQILAHGCELQSKQEDADIIIEARVGAMGGNQHDVVYGVPQSNSVSTVASLLPNSPPIPTIPEISVARKTHFGAAAKVAAFAYDRESRTPIWQSGTSVSDSTAKHTWLFGAGPFQHGEIYGGTKLAGSKLKWPWQKRTPETDLAKKSAFHGQVSYQEVKPKLIPEETTEKTSEVMTASHEETAASQPETQSKSEAAPPSEQNAAESKPIENASWETAAPDPAATPAKAPELPLD